MASGGGNDKTRQHGHLSQNEKSSRLQFTETFPGFGQFLIGLKSLLTRESVRTLATAFDFKPADIDKIEVSEDPGYVFINLLREKGIISPSDISNLISAFDACDLHGVANDVTTSFRRYQIVNNLKTTLPNPFEDKANFIWELKQKYGNLCQAVQPIPYIRERLFCVDKIFVEGGIEYLVNDDRNEGSETWAELNSYKDIFNNVKVQSVRRILEGDPGYGKSTLTLQIAYDWCNDVPNSVSSKYEVLILLRLKQLGSVTSIFKAIKQFILSKDCSLREADIQRILKESSSVLIIFDGFDEYPDRDSDVTSDVKSIIKRDMFPAFDVVLSTRTACLPKDFAPQTKRIRLTGFDEDSRDEYIRKAVAGDDEDAVMTLKRRLQENPVLAALCQVPLFFAMYAHMSHESKLMKKFKSVTSFFRHMIWCFHHHMKNKARDENVQIKYSLLEEDHHELDKVAFEGLCAKDQQLTWQKNELRFRLEPDFYDYYVRLGILVEEGVLDFESTSGSAASNLVKETTEVRFYHKLFCEWYAAHFVSTFAGNANVRFMGSSSNLAKIFHKLIGRKDISEVLQEVDPFDLQYVFRFACGLNQQASGKIIEYLKNTNNAHNFAVLCILEKEGHIQNILDSVRDICSKVVRIDIGHSVLLQRSTIQLLDIAAKNEISISEVYLHNYYSTVDLSGGNHLQLKSNISVPVLTTLNKLTIYEEGRDISGEEFAGILQYSSKCLTLKELEIWRCLPPQSVQAESVSVLRSRNVGVIWFTLRDALYRLNLKSSRWERGYLGDGGVMTDKDYQEEVFYIRILRRNRVIHH